MKKPIDTFSHETTHEVTHHMKDWPLYYREDRGFFERVCPHGVGHPDPNTPHDEGNTKWVHGCDGCCTPPIHEEVVIIDEDYPPNQERDRVESSCFGNLCGFLMILVVAFIAMCVAYLSLPSK